MFSIRCLAQGWIGDVEAHLDGVFQRAGEQEEGGRLLKALLAQQGEGVLQGCLAPAVLAEVVTEELGHLLLVLRPDTQK